MGRVNEKVSERDFVPLWDGTVMHSCSCGSVVEHCVSSAKIVDSIPREHTY